MKLLMTVGVEVLKTINLMSKVIGATAAMLLCRLITSGCRSETLPCVEMVIWRRLIYL